MKSYYRIMLGKKSVYAKQCIAGNFIGTDFDIHQDLSAKLPEDWRIFNREFNSIFLKLHPDKSKIAAGLACGALWTVSKGVLQGDLVLCPDGEGHYYVGEVVGDYVYQADEILPHRRSVRWLAMLIARSEMSEPLRNSTGAIGTVSNINSHGTEIEKLIGGTIVPSLFPTDPAVEDPIAFALEAHLEDFLVLNWSRTLFAAEYDIYEDENGNGQQYRTDSGRIDILAVSKDKGTLLVLELKRGRASDVVVGQILRYIGYVKNELAENGQLVRGAIIALDNDKKIQQALVTIHHVDFYRYHIDFKLLKVSQE